MADVDVDRIRQVVSTLLDTAMHETATGGPIEVTLATRPEAGEATIGVRHHGAGIPPANREAVFNRFSPAHSDDSRANLGLGLFLCREVVAAHGGRIDVEFPADGGNRFIVTLPLAS